MMSIYMDNAATSVQKPVPVAQAMYDALQAQQYGNPSRGAHGYSLRAYEQVLTAKKLVKQLLQASSAYEVAFAANSTMALNEVLKGLLRPGDHVLTTMWEHNAVLRPLYQLEAIGVTMDVIPAESLTGRLLYEEFDRRLRPETKMVVCNHASNVTGNVIDLEWIKAFCKAHSLLLVVDVSQTAGAYPIDLSDDIITAVCFTGHKALGGPGGTGGVCIKRDLEILPFMTGGDGTHSFSHTQPAALPGVFEAGTMNVIGIIGLAAGIQYLLSSGIEKISAGQRKLSQAFLQPLRTIPGITLYGDFTGPRVSVFSLNVKDAESALVSDILWEEYSIATRSGYHCAPLMHEALGTKEQGAVRFSFSNYTTIAEIELAIAALRDIAGR